MGSEGPKGPIRRGRKLKPLPLFDEHELISFLDLLSLKPIHATTIWKHYLRNNGTISQDTLEKPVDLTPIEKLPAILYQAIPGRFGVLTSRVSSAVTSADGSTTKLLIELQDKQQVEAVIMRHSLEEGKRRHVTLCVSSQVGCQMGCTFCATGTLGLTGNLCGGEILEQLIHANNIELITNVVFMGMGEPLHNYQAVLSAIRAMVDKNRFGLAPSRITVSTVGVIPYMKKLTVDCPQVQLAVSLHAPNQQLRSEIVPVGRTFTLPNLIDTIKHHIQTTGKHVLIEYVVLAGVNDLPEHAHQLGLLLKGMDVKVNLIPYNPTSVSIEYEAPSLDIVRVFSDILIDHYSLLSFVRKEMGQDIAGACGQLALTRKVPNQLGYSSSSTSKNNSKIPGQDRSILRACVDMEDLFPDTSTSATSIPTSLKSRSHSPSESPDLGVSPTSTPSTSVKSGPWTLVLPIAMFLLLALYLILSPTKTHVSAM